MRFQLVNEFSLLPFQREGAEWLAGRKLALLADEMRLGKSPQTIFGLEIANCSRILVVCPAVARVNWAREFDRWAIFPKNVQILSTYSDVARDSAEVVICSFEYVTRFYLELCSRRWSLLLVDEVHFVKSVDAKRSGAVFGRSGIVRAAERTWVLSGTPAPNHAGELWILLFTFGVTKLPYPAFVDKYCETVPTGYGEGYKITGTKKSAIPELRALLKQVMLRRTMKQVMPEVKEPLFSSFVVEAGSVEGLIDLTRELKEKLEQEGLIVSDLFENARLTDDEKLRMLEGLASSVSTLRRYTGLQRVAPAIELVQGELEIGLYDKVVIFAIHRSVVEALKNGFEKKGFGVVVLNGDSTPKQKQQAQDSFNTQKTIQIFIGNILSAGTNITLAAAHTVLFVEEDWVPGNNAQAAKRCTHIKKLEPISVRFLTLCHPIVERISRVVQKKTKELTEIFDD